MLVISNDRLRNKFFADLQSFKELIKLDKFSSRIEKIEDGLRQKSSTVKRSAEQRTSKGEAPGNTAALYFKDGSVMIGELISSTEDEYIINWKGQETIVFAGQVDHIGSAADALKEKSIVSDEEISKWWPYDNDIVVRLTNRVVLDAKIKDAGREEITLLYVEDRGYIEQDIERSKVEYLIFKPVANKESQRIEAMLRKLFPNMEFYKVGNFTILSDSDIIWIREYRQTLRSAYTNLYLKFFDVFKERRPKIQNFVVIFDDYADFFEYAIADGVPAWAVAGYFKPDDKILYLFNTLGDRFSEVLFQGMVGESGRNIDEMVDAVERCAGERYRIFIEGQAKVIRDKYWKAYSYYKGMFREETMSTLRHEFAHEIFHNWGLQSVLISKIKDDKEKLVEKKKEFLETKDCRKKAELIKTLMALRTRKAPLDVRAANSWLAEGIATYCETNPAGSRNDKLLFLYQEMARKEAIYPLESLTVYKMGSFPGVCSEAMAYLYAQSWAFVTFLMDEYPEEFMDYQSKMARKTAQDYEDITWLLESLGKDLRTVEKEFVEYMNRFEELDDPYVRHFETLYNIFNE